MNRLFEALGYLFLIGSAYPIGFFITKLILTLITPVPHGVDMFQ
jgi:hypothetical protein